MDSASNQLYTIEESLQRIPFFSSLSTDTLSAIAARLQKRRFEHGQVIFTENSLGHTMYLIESGQVQVSVAQGEGQPRRQGRRPSGVGLLVAHHLMRDQNSLQLSGCSPHAAPAPSQPAPCWQPRDDARLPVATAPNRP